MSNESILAIIAGITTVISSCIGYYLHILGMLRGYTAEAIDKAEETLAEGREKLNIAIDRLIERIPAILKPFIQRSWLENLVQSAFDRIESYAKKQQIKK